MFTFTFEILPYCDQVKALGLKATQIRDVMRLEAHGIKKPGKSIDDIISKIEKSANPDAIIRDLKRIKDLLPSKTIKKTVNKEKKGKKEQSNISTVDIGKNDVGDDSVNKNNMILMERIVAERIDAQLALAGLTDTGDFMRKIKRLLTYLEKRDFSEEEE